MGVETLMVASLALTAASSYSQLKTSKKAAENVTTNATYQAEALKAEGDLAIEQRSKEVELRAARQVSSFISSGLTLEGSPQAILNETFDVGIKDIKNIGKNYQTSINNTISSANVKAKDIIRQGRTQAINTIASAASSFTPGGIGSGGSLLGTQGAISRTAAFGTPSGVGPIKSFGGF